MQPLRLAAGIDVVTRLIAAFVGAVSLPVTSRSQRCEPPAMPTHLSHGDAIGGCLKH